MTTLTVSDAGAGRLAVVGRLEGEGDLAGVVGDLAVELAPGEDFLDVPFPVWAAHLGEEVTLAQLEREAAAASAAPKARP